MSPDVGLREQRALIFAEADLYPVTSAPFSRGRRTPEIVEAVVAAGCRVVQLREKQISKREYFRLAQQVRALVPRDVLLICNDHLDVALAVDADGVHLGNNDLPLEAARELAPHLLIGASTHSLQQALTAQELGADYVNIGPIFSTATKASGRFLGPEAIGRIGPRLEIPFTVMGGIKGSNIEQVLQQGARRIAVVTAVTDQPDPRAAAEGLRRRIREFVERG
jgi:thiamine-phosphate pyrophosphorylase